MKNITTYGELKDMLPSTGNRRVPGKNNLRKNGTLLIKRDTSTGIIEIYDNGFFIFEECGQHTVFGVDRCENPELYSYDGKRQEGEKKPDFSSFPWDLILESAGSARLSHNEDSRELYKEEISLDDPASESNPAFSVKPEYEVREEEENYAEWREKRVSKMHEAMEKPTERQKEIAMMYFRDKKSKEEIAGLMGKSQQYVSKVINRYKEIIEKSFNS